MLPAVHNFLIIYIYRKHYPAEEIPPLSRILNTVFSILCLIDLLLLVLALLFEAPKNDFSEKNSLRIWTVISCMIILVITIGIQVTGSFRLIKKVRARARQQLENSFV
jgi:protein-S-isoprenylcysteine O-methyltransferase Ste14